MIKEILSMCKLASQRIVFLGLFFSLLPGTLAALDKTVSRDFIVEPPTLISLGFEWHIDGDDNSNAEVSVQYRKKGEKAWSEGLPLLRLQREQTYSGAFRYTAPNAFAGSIFDLEAGTEYECRFVLVDPDGIEGKSENLATVRTRFEPRPFAGGRVYHVYPPGFKGEKQTPAFTGLAAAYFMGASRTDNFNTYPPRVQPGDTILVHAGTYRDDRTRYAQPGAVTDPSGGTYYLTQSGTPDKPIVIKAAGDGEVIFDGDGAYNLFNVMAANDNYFEGLTIRNTDLAFLAGLKNIAGSRGLTVKKCRFENIGRGISTDWSGSKDFYIADNVFIGRNRSDILMGWIGATWQKLPGFPNKLLSEYAVKVYGSGHVVAYNYVANFHDGIDHATYGDPDGTPNPIRDRLPVSIDFYNNDIRNVDDNCIEADGAAHNIRVFRNRCFNHAHRALSTQPVFGGPVYFVRNIVYHAPEGGALKFCFGSSGILVYHNTLIAAARWMLAPVSNLHFRNNLILGRSEVADLFTVQTFTNYSSSDYNGFHPNEDAESSFEWDSPPFSTRVDYKAKPEMRKYKTLQEFSAATGQDKHSVLVDYDVFQKVSPPDPASPTKLYNPADFDFRLQSGSAAVDAGIRLPNINDDFAGQAPDLGAYEAGSPVPHYGPRP
jgi:hypothetical protein